MNDSILAGIFGLLGVFIGALIQFYVSRRATEESRYLELKSQAYADYLNSIAAVAFAAPHERPKALQAVAAAKTRLCVFGDGPIIDLAVNLENTSLDLSQTDAQEAFIRLLQAMRQRGVVVGQVNDSAFQVLLLGERDAN